MDIVYYIVGAFVLWVIGRVLKNRTASALPARIQLTPVTASGKHAKELLARKRDLDACGMKRIGTYRVDPLNVFCTAFSNDAEAMCAVVYQHPSVGCFVDVVSKNTLGRTFTASNAPAGGTLDQREGHPKVFDRTLTIPEMLALVKKRRPEGPWESWSAGTFAPKFETAYAEEMAWRAGRGGATVDEVRRTAQASGKKYSEATIQKATEKIQEQYAETHHDV